MSTYEERIDAMATELVIEGAEPLQAYRMLVIVGREMLDKAMAHSVHCIAHRCSECEECLSEGAGI